MRTRQKYKFYFILLGIISLLWVGFTPAISSQLLQPLRQNQARQFVSTLEQRSILDPQSYWKFREFYSPGSFIFSNKFHVPPQQIPDDLLPIFDKLEQSATISPFLVFNSSHFHSVDSLLSKQIDLTLFVDPSLHYLVKTPQLLLGESDGKYSLIFLVPISELKKAYGFFDDDSSNPYFNNKYCLGVAIFNKH